MRIGIVTREWPPDVYGGAGVHVEHLVAAMRSLPDGPDIAVHCFGEPRTDAVAHGVPPGLQTANGALQAVGVDVEIAAALEELATEILIENQWRVVGVERGMSVAQAWAGLDRLGAGALAGTRP